MFTNVIITTQFEAIHAWYDCPYDDVSYLRYPHRHIFYVTMKFNVSNDSDRELEFIRLKNKINYFIENNWRNNDLGYMSCEDICRKLMVLFGPVYVSVFEDNENGVEMIAS